LSLAIYLSNSVPQFCHREHQTPPLKKIAHWGQLSPKIWSLQATTPSVSFLPQPKLSSDHLSIQVVAASTRSKRFIIAACIPNSLPFFTPLQVLYTFLQALTLGKAICAKSPPATRPDGESLGKKARLIWFGKQAGEYDAKEMEWGQQARV
jgi:hypothetical protein